MTRVVAALDNDSAARPVAATASRLAELLDASAEAIHVREDGQRTVEGSAAAAGMHLRTVSGNPLSALVAVCEETDVRALVLGTCGVPGSRTPAGSTVLELITRVHKPLVVVPPASPHAGRIDRVLVPLDGTPASTEALKGTIRLARWSEVEVIVLHVHEHEQLPGFSDHVQHEAPAWADEFMARYWPVPPGEAKLELRVGPPQEHVIDVATELDVDLVTLGWSQELSPGRAAVVREALARCPVPVLLVPVDDGHAVAEDRPV